MKSRAFTKSKRHVCGAVRAARDAKRARRRAVRREGRALCSDQTNNLVAVEHSKTGERDIS